MLWCLTLLDSARVSRSGRNWTCLPGRKDRRGCHPDDRREERSCHEVERRPVAGLGSSSLRSSEWHPQSPFLERRLIPRSPKSGSSPLKV